MILAIMRAMDFKLVNKNFITNRKLKAIINRIITMFCYSIYVHVYLFLY